MMKGSTKNFIKRKIAWLLIVLMSINSFAAVVGDNDGAAFITKAEFESLRNDFQTQINRYNTSLDNKIDGSIANYLSGVTVAKQSALENLLISAKNNSNYNVGFVRWETPPASSDVPDVSAALYWNRTYDTSASDYHGKASGSITGNLGINNASAYGGGLEDVRYHDYDKPVENYNSYLYLVNFPFAEQDTTNRCSTGDVTNFELKYDGRYRCYFNLRSNYVRWTWVYPNAGTAVLYPIEDEILSDFSSGAAAISNGPGFAADPSTHPFGPDEYTYPTLYISHTWYTWSDTGRTTKKLNYQLADEIPSTATDSMVDFDFRDSYVTDNPFDCIIAKTAPRSYASGGGYTGSYNNLYYVIGDGVDIPRYLARYGNASNLGAPYRYDMAFRWKWNRQKIYTLNWENLTSGYYNDLYKTPYYKYNGIPICKTTTATGKLKFKLKFTNKVLTTGANLAPASGNYTYVIMDKKFKNGNLPTMTETDSYYRDADGYNHVFKRETRNTGAAIWTTDWIEIDKDKIIDKDNGDYIYIKIAPANQDQVVSVEVVDTITYTEE